MAEMVGACKRGRGDGVEHVRTATRNAWAFVGCYLATSTVDSRLVHNVCGGSFCALILTGDQNLTLTKWHHTSYLLVVSVRQLFMHLERKLLCVHLPVTAAP